MRRHYTAAAVIGFTNCGLGLLSAHGIPKELNERLLANGHDLTNVLMILMVFAYLTYWYSFQTLKKLLMNELSVFSLNGYINISLLISLLMTIFSVMMIQDPTQIITQPLLWMSVHFICGVNGALGLAIGVSTLRNDLITWGQFKAFSISMILMSIPAFMMSSVPFLMLMNTPDQLKLSFGEYTRLLMTVLHNYHYELIFEAFRILSMSLTFTLALVFLRAAQISRPQDDIRDSATT